METPPSTATTREQYDASHPVGIERHYWHQGRNRILLRKIRPLISGSSTVLDIGCGPGIVVDFLRGKGIHCLGVEVGSPRPATPAVAEFLTLEKSAFDLDETLRTSVDLILLMDVLEHLPEPTNFLRQCSNSFPNAAYVFVTLPARMELWSNYDEHFGHFSRYTTESAAALVDETDFEVDACGYMFHCLYLAARGTLLLSKQRPLETSAPRLGLPHRLIGRALELEQRLLPASLPGSSLWALFKRRV